jgi:hypothetical protein
MRKSRPESTSTHSVQPLRHVVTRIPQPGRRRLALEAENRKVRAQIGPRISWIH